MLIIQNKIRQNLCSSSIWNAQCYFRHFNI